MAEKRTHAQDRDYDRDLTIDKYALDQECERQPYLYQHYAELEADAEAAAERAKHRRDIVEAEVDTWVRSELEQSGQKVTEKLVKNQVLLSDKYQAAVDDYIEAVRRHKILRGVAFAFWQRKNSLEGLIELDSRSYFASPRQDQVKQDQGRVNVAERVQQRQEQMLEHKYGGPKEPATAE